MSRRVLFSWLAPLAALAVPVALYRWLQTYPAVTSPARLPDGASRVDYTFLRKAGIAAELTLGQSVAPMVRPPRYRGPYGQRLTVDQVQMLRRVVGFDGLTQLEWARRLGVSTATISRVINYLTYEWVDDPPWAASR